MKTRMFGTSHNQKVSPIIVKNIAVKMMNNLIRFKSFSYISFCCKNRELDIPSPADINNRAFNIIFIRFVFIMIATFRSFSFRAINFSLLGRCGIFFISFYDSFIEFFRMLFGSPIFKPPVPCSYISNGIGIAFAGTEFSTTTLNG